MKKRINSLNQAANDDAFKSEAERAFEEEWEKAGAEDSPAENAAAEQPILSEKELKVRKAKRTRVAVAAFVLLLGIGVMGNWYYENSDFSASVRPLITSSETKTLGEAEYVDGTTQSQNAESEYFSQARVERQTARDEAIEKLQSIIDKADESEESKKIASEGIAQISNYISIENKIETLAAAKGVKHCLAVVSSDGTRVDVIIDVDELTDDIILQMKEIAMQQLGVSFENVSVIQCKS